MIPTIVIQIALIIIVVRSVYVVVQRINSSHKAWIDILFHASVAIVALNFLLR
jgi:steroid 5-alpha reductase family enzyme